MSKNNNRQRFPPLPSRFNSMRYPRSSKQANKWYHADQRSSMQALLKVIEWVDYINSLPTTNDAVFAYHTIVDLLHRAIIHLENAEDGRIYACDHYFRGRMDRAHENALRMIVNERISLQSYLKYIESTDEWLYNYSLEKPIYFDYLFTEARMATDREHGLTFPTKCIYLPAEVDFVDSYVPEPMDCEAQ